MADEIDEMEFILPPDSALPNYQNLAGNAEISHLPTDIGGDPTVAAANIHQHFAHRLVVDDSQFKKKTVSEGRRVPKRLAVPTDPLDSKRPGIPLTCWHLARACELLCLRLLVEEQKRYSRDYWAYGRIRVIFDKSLGVTSPEGNQIRTKRGLMEAIAKILPGVQKELMAGRPPIKLPPAGGESVDMRMKREILSQFQYGSDPFVSTMMLYGYGMVPSIISSPQELKQHQALDETAGADPNTKPGKKSKKNKKK